MTAATLALTDFLLARIAEDEEAARAVGSSGEDQHWWVDGPAEHSGKWWVYSTGEKFAHEHTARHVARHDPARMLAECEAKRRIVKVHRPHDHGGEHGGAVFCDECQWDHGGDSPRIDNQPVENFGANPCRTLAALAAVYADHPDYREEWKV